jgi:predicted small secreted protein
MNKAALGDGLVGVAKIISLAILASTLWSGCAQLKEAGRTIGHTARDVSRTIGHGARDVVHDIGDGIRDTTQSGSEEVKKAVKPGSTSTEY